MSLNADIPRYVAHKSEDGARFESVKEHLEQVAEMAADFARPFGAEQWAFAAGMAHDIGKYSRDFQHRIQENGSKVDHSTAGAAALFSRLESVAYTYLPYCVAGHHGGLPDGGTLADDGATLAGRLAKARRGEIPNCSAWASEVELAEPTLPQLDYGTHDEDICFRLAFLTRMVFSCLVDADFLCTERFMSSQARRGLSCDGIAILRDALEEKLAGFYPPKTKLNMTRCDVLDDCLQASGGEPGFYTLTAPTGSGKTFALMRFALNHALSNRGMRRVIVAEPYTSIIEQNAEVYRGVFGPENILEHQGNFDFDASELEGNTLGFRLRLAAENWDAPIVVTTNVQLFESLYSSKPSRCRKLHNIAGSVIVLDEAQTIPTEYLVPCLKALAELVKNYGCSVVLSTATQPALNKLLENEGVPNVVEIMHDVDGLFAALERVTYCHLGIVDDEQLAQRMLRDGSALCIVNSRKQAKALYDILERAVPADTALFHLTTLMHPAHRKRVLAEITHRTKVCGGSCLVVATSLVEAGVDLDFPIVYRATAGIDSLVQAAGRCNREGRLAAKESMVYIFEPGTGYVIPAELRQRASASNVVMEHGSWPGLASPETVAKYFEYLHFFKGPSALDKHDIVGRLSQHPQVSFGDGFLCSVDFRGTSEDFHFIDEGSCSVAVPCRDIEDELERMHRGVARRGDMRRLSMHSVSLYEADLKNLLSAGAVEKLSEGVFVLLDAGRYSEKTGLDVAAEGGEGLYW